MPDQFYYRNESDDPVGPMTPDEILKLAQAGIIPPPVQVRKIDESDWQPLTEFTPDPGEYPSPVDPCSSSKLPKDPPTKSRESVIWESFIALILGDVPKIIPRHFHFVLTAAIGATFLSILAALFLESSLPPQLLDYLDVKASSPASIIKNFLGLVELLVLIAVIVSYTGLYMFKRWARAAFLILCVITFFMTLLWGPFVETGAGAAFEGISILLQGVIIALAYFSPISSKFS